MRVPFCEPNARSPLGTPWAGAIVDNMAAASRVSMSNRLLEAAARLLREGGVEAVSTRAVAAAAGNQPPVLYS